MRDFKGMKRQRGRNRGGGQTGGKPQQHNANRAFESNGPDNVKIRGAAQHVFEKYQQLARDAHSSGDRVLAENYLQHAEHYFRVIRAVTPNKPTAEIMGRDAFASGYDIDFEDENGNIDGGEGGQESEGGEGDNGENGQRQEYRQDQQRPEQQRNDQQRNDQQRNDQQRQDYRRDDRQPRRDDRPYNRDDRPRDDRPRDDRPRDDRPREDRVQRDERPREDRVQRDDRPRDDQPRREYTPREDRAPRERYNRDDRPREPRADPLAVVQPQATPLTEQPAEASSPLLRSGDGDVSHAPAFLQVRPERPRVEAPVEAAAEPVEKRARAPRKRRAAADDAAPAAPETEQA